MTDDEKEREAELALSGWRLRWALFAVGWVLLVLLLAALLWPSFTALAPRERVLGLFLVAVLPPTLDYVVSRGIAGVIGRRLHRSR